MTPELKEAWLADLRAHPELKGEGALKSEQKYCCLGRLLIAAGLDDEIRNLQSDQMEELTADLLDQLGLDTEHQSCLIDLNDDGGGDYLNIDGDTIPAPDYSEVITYIEENL